MVIQRQEVIIIVRVTVHIKMSTFRCHRNFSQTDALGNAKSVTYQDTASLNAL